MIGILLITAGVAGVAWGADTATSGRRPLDLVAALTAPLGVAVALAGALALAIPGFLSGLFHG